jgi:hypothetical protein
VLVQIKA